MLRTMGRIILRRWHKLLNLPRQSPLSWHRDRYREELSELHDAKTRLEKLSEASDVFFALSRAKYDGFPIADLPSFRTHHIAIYGYMLAKYTSRWAFYRVLAFLCKSPSHSMVREVVNPSKDSKLEVVARRHNIDPAKFTSIGRQLRRVWPLPP
ncbi:hypothetical protein F5Y12DRAFT_734970 [Xylaria sp. FL1777]|nr:hypothetical protein F5Y12DRAFT_734970 [Xylaria sp. FL1777]